MSALLIKRFPGPQNVLPFAAVLLFKKLQSEGYKGIHLYYDRTAKAYIVCGTRKETVVFAERIDVFKHS